MDQKSRSKAKKPKLQVSKIEAEIIEIIGRTVILSPITANLDKRSSRVQVKRNRREDDDFSFITFRVKDVVTYLPSEGNVWGKWMELRMLV